MKQPVKTVLLTGSIAVLSALGVLYAVAAVKSARGGGEAGVRVWFYDQTAKRLYPAPRSLIPPDGNTDAKVRAMAIGFQGPGTKTRELKIAYLEKFSPELKGLLERAEAAHAAKRPFGEEVPAQSSAYFQTNCFVKGPEESEWHPSNSPEARRVMTEWRGWRGPDGQEPVVCVP